MRTELPTAAPTPSAIDTPSPSPFFDTPTPTPTYTPWPPPTPTPTATPMPLFGASLTAGKVLLLRHDPEGGYYTVGEAGGGNIHVLDTRGKRPLATGGGWMNARWLNEAEVLALRREGEDLVLLVISGEDGSVVRTLATFENKTLRSFTNIGSRLYGLLEVSPQATHVLVETHDGLYVVDVTVGGAGAKVPGWFPSWSPDGRNVASYADEGLWITEVETGGSREVGPDVLRWDNRYSRQMDGVPWAEEGVFVIPSQEGEEVSVGDFNGILENAVAFLDTTTEVESLLVSPGEVRQALADGGISFAGKVGLSPARQQPGGELLAFSALDGQTMYLAGILDQREGSLQVWAQAPSGYITGISTNVPVWSPNGLSMALYVVVYGGTPREYIHVLNLETGQLIDAWVRDSSNRLI
ncbi:MAG: hypothetical protein HY532_09510, partial [Chloroflexi bacterium]|nr:hypothetical protein [Chloroflexota bacterium]